MVRFNVKQKTYYYHCYYFFIIIIILPIAYLTKPNISCHELVLLIL